ncbi:MAG TPA: hypothetical protein VF723_16480 [Pyrinomonadaceae bacterium]|jgi:hypothetical protein
MLRAAALSLLILGLVAVTLPLIDSSAHDNGRAAVTRRSRAGRRHSRAWWRRYRARMRRKRAALQRRSAPKTLSRQDMQSPAESHNPAVSLNESPAKNGLSTAVRGGQSLVVPGGWSRRSSANGETRFVVTSREGRAAGQATLALYAPGGSSEAVTSLRGQRKMLGGVPVTLLRRSVIDKMITANGWVLNDLQREIQGRPVLVVLAQTPASGDGRTPQQSWAFYFIEVEGRIYSLATSAPEEFFDQLSAGADRLLASLCTNISSTLAATPQR